MAKSESSFLDQPRRNFRFVLIALALTLIIVGAFFYESRVGFGKRPQTIIYAASWPASRSGADAVREQNVRETQRQTAIAQFEIERGEAMRSRANTVPGRAQADAHISRNRAALERWTAAHAQAEAVLAAHPPQPIVDPVAH